MWHFTGRRGERAILRKKEKRKREHYNTYQRNTNTIRECLKKNFIKLENMKEIDEFLYSPKILKLNQEEVKNLNRSTTNELIETVIYIKKKTFQL